MRFRKGWQQFSFVVMLALAVIVTGCGSGAGTGTGNKGDQITAVTTTGMVGDLVKNIGGEHVAVESLMGPGVDPHLYKASQGDIAKLGQAQIVFYNGLHLEGKMTDVFEQIAKQKPAIAVTESMPESELHKPAAFQGQHDPHVWFDVKLWMKAADRVKEGLIEADPAHKSAYEANAAAYKKQLQELDDYARQQIAQIPKESRVLVTAHDAFGYFGTAYDIEVMGLQGISTDSEYGLKDVQKLVEALVEKKIKAVFVESSVPKKAIEAVVEGANAKNHQVKIGGELFSDALGNAGTAEGTYIGMVRHNVDTIVNALK